MPKVPPKKPRLIPRVLGEFFKVELAQRKGLQAYKVTSNFGQLGGLRRTLECAQKLRNRLNIQPPQEL